jgi:hypothetical protein
LTLLRFLLPNRKQWNRWSLPSKLTAVGTYIGIFMFLTWIMTDLVGSFRWPKFFGSPSAESSSRDSSSTFSSMETNLRGRAPRCRDAVLLGADLAYAARLVPIAELSGLQSNASMIRARIGSQSEHLGLPQATQQKLDSVFRSPNPTQEMREAWFDVYERLGSTYGRDAATSFDLGFQLSWFVFYCELYYEGLSRGHTTQVTELAGLTAHATEALERAVGDAPKGLLPNLDVEAVVLWRRMLGSGSKQEINKVLGAAVRELEWAVATYGTKVSVETRQYP